MRQLVRRLFVSALVIAVATTLSGCGDDSATDAPGASDGTVVTAVTVADATVNKPVSGQPNAGVYAVVTNGTDADITIIGATSPVSDNVQLHLTVDGGDGTMSMQQVDSIEVASGDRFAFEPGGPHIMLIGVDADNFPADIVEVTLQLGDGSEIPFVAEVHTLETSSTAMVPGGDTTTG